MRMKVLVLQHNLKQLTIRIFFRCENIHWGAPRASLFLLPVVPKNRSGRSVGSMGRLPVFLISYLLPQPAMGTNTYAPTLVLPLGTI